MSNPPQSPLVLVADGDDAIRGLARRALESDGFSVVEAADGVEALAQFDSRAPALVLLDAHLPRLSGFSACDELRRRYPGDPTPVVMMTDAEDPASIDRAYDAGAADFVSKPINWALMGHRVRYLLRSSAAFAELERWRVLLANAQRIARLGSWEWNTDTDEMRWSAELFRIFGLDPAGVGASSEGLWNAIHPEDRALVRREIEEGLRVAGRFRIDHRLRLPDGQVRYAQQQGELAIERRGSASIVSGTLQDVTDQWLVQDKIRELANYDSLTGLANRRLFMDRLSSGVARARENGHRAALLYMDLDRFKRINDTLGHAAGDALLKAVSARIGDHVRGRDLVARADAGAAISRLGGDEFTVVLSKISEAQDAGDVARRILRALPEPIAIEGSELSVTASIGIAVFPDDGEDVETLVKHADRAMYHAKDRGRNRYQFFSDSMNAASLRKLTLESRLREALERSELRVHYQPRVDLRTDTIAGAEALLRWKHPELGVVSPKEFIPLTEEMGLIVPIGAWVLNRACEQLRAWQDAGHTELNVSVNVSPRQFARRDLVQTVADALTRNRLAPQSLEVEITEGAMLQENEATSTALHELRAMGVRVALDDFGTGYASLSYLTRIPHDTLKIDRCFVRDLHTDPAAPGITAAVITMAQNLGARVVAEGVDLEDQLEILREQGCDEMQGFLFSPALPPEEFMQLLSSPPKPKPKAKSR